MQQNGCDEYLYNGTELDQYKQCGVIPNSIGTSYWEYSYDNRGNLTGSNKYTRTTEGMKMLNVAAYVYDETNRLVSGKNEQGEYSLYTYNGLGVRVGRELIMQDNTHGYTDFHDLTPSVETGLNKPEVVKESYVVDYTTATRETLTMHEEGGFDYRWVYGLDRLSVKVTSEGTNWWGQNVKQDILKDYAHQDRMGSTTNLTDQFGRVVGRADYNEWGELTYKEELNITSAYRRIYPQASYTGHDWDDVLGMYYAKARFYDPAAKRFVAMDPIKGSVIDPLSLVPYIYCVDNPLRYVDPLGLSPFSDGTAAHLAIGFYLKSIDPRIKLETSIRGERLNLSGRGRVDVMRPYKWGYEVYEIKPISAQKDTTYGFLAHSQMFEYVIAINNDDRNNNYRKAIPGESLLEQIDGVILPFPDASGRHLEIVTDAKDPGMIYYKLSCKEKQKEYAYNYSEEEEKKLSPYLKPWYTYTPAPVFASYADSQADIEFFTGMKNYAENAKVGETWTGNDSLGKPLFSTVETPDGKTFYRYEGLFSFDVFEGIKRPTSRPVSIEEKIFLSYGMESIAKKNGWASTTLEAFLLALGGNNDSTDMGLVPAPDGFFGGVPVGA